MKNIKFKKIKGYIEGYYGKLLSWNQRIDILKCLSQNRMNFYFYCPKEDLYHRYQWKKKYPYIWARKFEQFCDVAKNNKVNVIAGVSPGLNLNFKSFLKNDFKEFKILLRKLVFLKNKGANCLALLLDDIPNNYQNYCTAQEEGIIHAKLINKLYENLQSPFFVVPRIYSEELFEENKDYLNHFLKELNENIYIFYCGKYIVSKEFKSSKKFINSKVVENKIVFWDNFYANDYCPKRLIVGPWNNKNIQDYSMINGTGLVNTDKLILEIVNKTSKIKNKIKNWKNVIIKNKIPEEFFKVSIFFNSPNFTNEVNVKKIKFNNTILNELDTLIWKWKSPLSLEWYQYLLNLRHDLQILNNELPFNRILKTQTKPIQIKLINKE